MLLTSDTSITTYEQLKLKLLAQVTRITALNPSSEANRIKPIFQVSAPEVSVDVNGGGSITSSSSSAENVTSVQVRRPQTPGPRGRGRRAVSVVHTRYQGQGRGRGRPTSTRSTRRGAQWNSAAPRYQGRNYNNQPCQQCDQYGHKSEHCEAPYWCYRYTRRGHHTISCPKQDNSQNNDAGLVHTASQASLHVEDECTETQPQEDVYFDTFQFFDTPPKSGK